MLGGRKVGSGISLLYKLQFCSSLFPGNGDILNSSDAFKIDFLLCPSSHVSVLLVPVLEESSLQ